MVRFTRKVKLFAPNHSQGFILPSPIFLSSIFLSSIHVFRLKCQAHSAGDLHFRAGKNEPNTGGISRATQRKLEPDAMRRR